MAAAVDDDRPVAGLNEGRDLVAEIAGMAHAAVQQDHRRPGADIGVPDPGTLALDQGGPAGGQGRRAVRREMTEVVVTERHSPSLRCRHPVEHAS